MKVLVPAGAALVAVALGAVAAVCAGPAAAQPAVKSDDSCFFTRYLRGHTVGEDGHTLFFNVDGKWTYRVTTTGACLAGVTPSDPIVLRDRSQGRICKPIDLDLAVRGNRCIVSGLIRLTPAEASTLPKRLQP